MRSDLWLRAGATVVISFLLWDNWNIREELQRLRETQPLAALPAAGLSAGTASAPGLAATEAKATGASSPSAACPPGTPNPTAKALELPTPAPPGAGSAAAPVQIPPNADLAEALRIIQRETAKNNPGSAGVSPFGGTR